MKHLKGGHEREKGRKSQVTTIEAHSSRGSLSQKAEAPSKGSSSAAWETQATMELSKLRDKLHSTTSRVKHIEELFKKDHKTFLYRQLIS